MRRIMLGQEDIFFSFCSLFFGTFGHYYTGAFQVSYSPTSIPKTVSVAPISGSFLELVFFMI
jgi:hypothetical protein